MSIHLKLSIIANGHLQTRVNSKAKILVSAILCLLFSSLNASANPSGAFDSFYGENWSGNIGFGSSRLNNILGMTREYQLDGNWKLHVGGGIGEVFLGGGVAWYQNPGREGLFLSFNAGLVGAHVNAGYQFDVGSRSFLILGAAIGSRDSFLGKSDRVFYPIIAYEYHFKEIRRVN